MNKYIGELGIARESVRLATRKARSVLKHSAAWASRSAIASTGLSAKLVAIESSGLAASSSSSAISPGLGLEAPTELRFQIDLILGVLS